MGYVICFKEYYRYRNIDICVCVNKNLSIELLFYYAGWHWTERLLLDLFRHVALAPVNQNAI